MLNQSFLVYIVAPPLDRYNQTNTIIMLLIRLHDFLLKNKKAIIYNCCSFGFNK